MRIIAMQQWIRDETMKTIAIEYRFTLADGSQEIFPLELDAQTLELRVEWPGKLPLWTDLTFYQCPHCHVTPAKQPYCPLAANIANIVMRFDHLISYDRIHLDVITQERVISQDTTAQQGVSSLLDWLSRIADVRILHFFKPMARFHLPLATVQETIFRAVSIYLISQYFWKQDGQPAILSSRDSEKFMRISIW
jgi:hypothetical protein